MSTEISDLNASRPPLTDDEREIYQWQMWVGGFGEEGQRRLKGASVLISRIGGVGSAVAYSLAAAGVGKLVLAHAGNIRPDDLNRQTLMTHDAIGGLRVESAERRLRELNPRLKMETIAENISPSNANRLLSAADLVVSCAPLFEERLAMNAAAVNQGKPMVDCAMYEMEAGITTIFPRAVGVPGLHVPAATAGMAAPLSVFGAVAAMIGSWGAMEAIKLISGLGQPLAGTMLMFDMGAGQVNRLAVRRDPRCPVCAGAPECALPAAISPENSGE